MVECELCPCVCACGREQVMVSLPVYLNDDRRHSVCSISLPAPAAIAAEVWQYRCVAVIAWQEQR